MNTISNYKHFYIIILILLSACTVTGLYSNPESLRSLQKIVIDTPVEPNNRYFYHALKNYLNKDNDLQPKMHLKWSLNYSESIVEQILLNNAENKWYKLNGTFNLFNDKNEELTSFVISIDDVYAVSDSTYSTRQSKITSLKYLGKAMAHQVRQNLLSYFIANN